MRTCRISRGKQAAPGGGTHGRVPGRALAAGSRHRLVVLFLVLTHRHRASLSRARGGALAGELCALLRTESHSNGALRDNTGAGHVMEGGGSGRRSGLRGQRAADDDLRVRRGAHARRQGACRGRLARCEREPLRSALRVKTRGHGNGVAATSRAPCKVSANGGGGALAPRNVHKTCVVHEQRARGGERGPGAPPAWCGWPWARSETPPAAAGSAPGACWHEAFLTARVCGVGAMCAHTCDMALAA